ncbi:MAG: SDR family NAD(P)-dependent oxidoreductase [Patescibacteria group bacterium]
MELSLKNKKVLVTGGAGFIGSHLVRRLLSEQADVHVLVRASTNTARIADQLSEITVHVADLDDHESIKNLLNILSVDGVFHLAAANQSFVERPTFADMARTNIVSTIMLMEEVAKTDIDFFVNTGSFVEYGPQEDFFSENKSLAPMDLYAISRVPSTLYTKTLGQYEKKPFVEVRVFTPYGPFMEKGKVIETIIASALRNEPIKLTRPNVVRDYIFIEDLVELYIRASVGATTFKGSVWNGGSGVSTSLEEVARSIIDLTNSTSEIAWSNQDISFDSVLWKADLTKVNVELGWTPSHSFAKGIERTVEWFKENPHQWR